MPNNVKTYDGTGDPEDHVKVFHTAAQVERWAMPTWCHMFNSTLIGAARVWFDELPPESIDGYKDLRAAFLAYFMQQKKYVKDSVEIHNIKQGGGETIEEFMERFKTETGRMKGAPECIRISGFMHGVNNPELTKRLNEHVPKTMEEMMITTTAFMRREAAAASKKKDHVSWKAQDQSKRHTSDKRTPKEILAAEASKFQPPPPMVTPIEKRSSNKFCDFHNDKGHSADECMQLKKQIEELEIKQGRDQSKTGKKETAVEDKPMTIYMVRSWQRTVKQKVTQSFWRVKEIEFPPLAASNGTEGPLVIEAEMGGHMIHRTYIDGGSSMEILYEHCFNRLRPQIKSQMVLPTTSLTGFSGETIWPLGQLRLLVIIGDVTHSTKAWMNFMIVKSLSPYNGIIGRPGLKAIQAVPSTVHGMLKFLVEGGIVTINSTILIPTECASVITSSVIPREERTRPVNFKVALHPDFPDQEVVIGGTLFDKGRTELCSVLKKNLDIFAWQPSDMTGVPRSVAEHQLNIREGYSPVWQKKMGQAPERAKAIQAEVQKLVEAGIMREVYYHDWLSNPVIVKKHDGSWRMCVDFMDLNKACPQDCYPLPKINWKVESLCGYPFKCFLDAYKGYHQIQLAEADEEKTAFHMRQRVYCYKKMPFGLKNAGATYRRLMDKAFEGQIRRNIKVYVDDLVVKSYTESEIMRDIEETFRTLRKVNMMLNLKKCSFRLAEGVFLEYVITPEGIKPCPDKTEVVLQLPSPRTIKEVQSLNGKLASLNSSQPPIMRPSEALVAGLRIATRMGVKNIKVSVDSKLVANQVLGTYVAKEDNMIKYLEIVKGLVLVEVLEKKSIKEKEVTAVIEEDGPTWMTQLVDYLKGGVLPGDKNETRKLRLKARQYELMEGVLYRRSFLTPWLRCVGPLQAEYVMREIHEESCSMHAGPRSVVAKAIRLGYYWPTMHKDARDMIRKCSDRPFPERPGKVKFLIVAMDYFTKWIEAKAVRTITGGRVKKFIWDNIVCRFGIPGEIISDNGKQFSDNPFKDWCSGEGNKNWVEELPHVLWVYRIMIKSSHNDTPFSLTYGTEAVIPIKIGMPTYRTVAVDVVNNNEELRLNLDLLEERRERAAICEAKAKSKMMKYYNARVHGVAFKPGDFVYRSNDVSHAAAGGKLGPKWEGPYEVIEALGNEAYKLQSMDGTILPRTWNIANLKRCYL
nr:reverse transcriptase domain-containing protein [Tanacetum cinerariifolium]